MSTVIDRNRGSIVNSPARINIEKMFPGGIFVGLIGVVITLAILLTSGGATKNAIAGSYLFSWIFWLSLTLGCFGLLMFYHLIRGRWMLPQLRLLEAGASVPMFLVFFVLFLPIAIPVLFHQHYLYEWADPNLMKTSHMLQLKSPYLNTGGWFVRYIIWFASWIVITAGFKASTKRQEKTGDLKELILRNNWAGAAFIWFALSLTFAMTDWVMAVDWRWFSELFGVWSLVQMGLGAYAFTVLIVCSNAKRDAYKNYINPDMTRDFGVILFVFVMLWAYTSFSQFLIIWSGNLPETNFYYVERSKMSWNIVGLITMVGQYFVPFIALLTPRNRKIPRNLAIIAGFMLATHLVDVYQYVLPALRHNGPMPTGFDFLAFFSIGFLWLGVFAAVLKSDTLMPKFDLRLEEETHGE